MGKRCDEDNIRIDNSGVVRTCMLFRTCSNAETSLLGPKVPRILTYRSDVHDILESVVQHTTVVAISMLFMEIAIQWNVNFRVSIHDLQA